MGRHLLVDGVVLDVQYQSDPMFSSLVMEHPVWQKDPDTVLQYFCWNVAKINCYNHYHEKIVKDGHFVSIEDMNEAMIADKGYLYLDAMKRCNGNTEEAKKLCLNREAESISSVQNFILDIKEEFHDYKGNIDLNVPNEYYIVKTPFQSSGHYSWLLGVYDGVVKYLDSYDGVVRTTKTWLDIIKIVFN